MTDETLVYNVDAIRELVNKLRERLSQFEDEIELMFNVIDGKMNQHDHWSGVTYDQFKDKCDGFRATEIERMIANLKAYIDHFTKTSDLSEETTAGVKGIVQRDALNNAGLIKNTPNVLINDGIIKGGMN